MGGGAEEAGTTINGVITNNLGRSGYFAPIDPASFIEQITDFNTPPRFGDWRQIQAKALVTGQSSSRVARSGAEFRLWGRQHPAAARGPAVHDHAQEPAPHRAI